MQISDFKSIVSTFADPGAEVLFEGSEFGVMVNGDVINGKVVAKSGDVYVDEGVGPEPATKWILNRLARLPLLASRLRETVAETEHFVPPSVSLLPTLEKKVDETPVRSDNGVDITLQLLEQRSPLETTVLYVTSGAGEGKTSLINKLAREQSHRYSNGKSDWLLVPIPLGGRHFLRFDDITVGVLLNRYRFSFLYYRSFLALVKMGVIVPAYDGFEEMFVESSSGEALSAMGILVRSLESQGAVVVAARSAYFEFENLRTKDGLFDTIRGYSVAFAKLELLRWDRHQFIAYCQLCGVPDPEEFYERVCGRLPADHALLTRAVLVKRLVAVAMGSESVDGFLDQLHRSGSDFFSVFVRGLIEREIGKWVDRSGDNDIGTPLLTVDEHCDLLSQVALAMWDAKVDYLNRDALEFTSDYFCATTSKNSHQARQIRERLRGHAMLIPSTSAFQAVEFDHDEFRHFFLGEAIAKLMLPMDAVAKAGVVGAFRRGALPGDAMLALYRAISRQQNVCRMRAVRFLLEMSVLDGNASYTHENVVDLVMRLLSGADTAGTEVSGLTFGFDSLRGKELSGVVFRGCYFANSSLDGTDMRGCLFADCTFAQLRMTERTRISAVTFRKCKVEALVVAPRDREIWNPAEIRQQLGSAGVTVDDDGPASFEEPIVSEPDVELVDLDKLIRYFLKSTTLSENMIYRKLGSRGQRFIDEVLPDLQRYGLIEEVENRGAGMQRRFRVGVSVQSIHEAMAAANGDFQVFLARFA